MHGNNCYWQGIYSIEEVKTYVVSFNLILILILIDINLTKFFSDFSSSTIRTCRAESVFHETLKMLAKMLAKNNLSHSINVFPNRNNRNERSASILQNGLTPINVFNSDARTSVSSSEIALFASWNGVNAKLALAAVAFRHPFFEEKERLPGRKKTSMRIAFYTKRRTTIFAKPFSPTTCKP